MLVFHHLSTRVLTSSLFTASTASTAVHAHSRGAMAYRAVRTFTKKTLTVSLSTNKPQSSLHKTFSSSSSLSSSISSSSLSSFSSLSSSKSKVLCNKTINSVFASSIQSSHRHSSSSSSLYLSSLLYPSLQSSASCKRFFATVHTRHQSSLTARVDEYDYDQDRHDQKPKLWKHLTFAAIFSIGIYGYMCHAERQSLIQDGAKHSFIAYNQLFRQQWIQFKQSIKVAPKTTWDRIKRMLGLDQPWSPAQKVIYSLIGANVIVFGLFALAKVKPWQFVHELVYRFIHNPLHPAYTSLTSIFAHGGLFHLAFNMLALKSFGEYAIDDLLGPHQFLAFFLTAGVLSSIFSTLLQVMTRNLYSGIGASGAVYALVTLLAVLKPDLQVSLLFALPLNIQTAVLGMLAMDCIGLVGGMLKLFSSPLGHAAHIGGALFGFLYAKYGAPIWFDQLQNFIRNSKKSPDFFSAIRNPPRL